MCTVPSKCRFHARLVVYEVVYMYGVIQLRVSLKAGGPFSCVYVGCHPTAGFREGNNGGT